MSLVALVGIEHVHKCMEVIVRVNAYEMFCRERMKSSVYCSNSKQLLPD